MAGSAFDLVIFGFRNDLARARALDFLAQLPVSQSGPTQIDHDTSMPQRLFAALEAERAQRLRVELDQLGAQVAVLEAGLPAPHDAEAPPAAPKDAPRSGIGPVTVLLVAALGAAAQLWRVTTPAPVAPPPHLPTAAALLHLPEHTEAESPAAMRLNSEAITLAAAGNFRDAVERLRMALQLLPNHPVLTRNLQTMLANWGTTDLAMDDLDGAAERLSEAAQLGDRAEVFYALGVTYTRQADYARAKTALDRALELAPTDRNTLLASAQLYLKLESRPQALALLQRAKEAGASGADLDSLVRQLSREVDAEWDFVHTQTRHFRASFADDGDRSAVRQVLYALEDAYEVVGSKFDYYPDERTTVVLYTQDDFHTITQAPDWAGADFDGRIQLPVRGLTQNDPALTHVVRHEYAHSVVARLTGTYCPSWLNEGLAVWAEEDRDGERTTWAQDRIAGQNLFTLEELSRPFVALPGDRVEPAYAESYLAVRTLIGPYGARKLPDLLRALSRTHHTADAFAAVYPGDLSGFQRQLLRQLSG